jgi:dolichol-phosphate mannosyltransferase
MMSQKKLSIIVPVYFNAESLLELFARLEGVERQLSDRNMAMELIFVDDGSKDNSFEVLREIVLRRPETKLIKLTRNFGGPASSWSGFAYATGDCVAIVSADLQDPPEQILPMVDTWQQGNRFVCSYRQSRKDPFFTRVCAGIFYKFLHHLVVNNYPRTGTDMVLMDKSLLPYILHLPQGVNYVIYLFWIGFEAKLLAYDRAERKYSKSRWTLKKKFFYFLDTIMGFSVTPLRLVTAVAGVVSIISLVYGIHIIIYALINGTTVPGFISLATLISFSTSVIVTMLGIIGEYIWRIFAIVSRHPKSVVDTAYLGAAEPSGDHTS